MKKTRKKLFVFITSLLIIIYGTIPVFAGSIANFPYQNTSSYQANYTRAVQAMLMDYSKITKDRLGKDEVDGSYGPATAASVKIFQNSEGLDDDGSCGPKTWAKINEIKKRWDYGFSNDYANYYFNGVWSKTKCYRQHNTSKDWQCYDGTSWRNVD